MRAWRTADVVLEALPAAPPPEIDQRLVEVDVGYLEGWTPAALAADPAARA